MGIELMENWLAVITGIYLLGMILYGHYRGFIRLAVSAVALVATLAVVHTASPYVTDFLKNNTKIYQSFEEGMYKAAGIDETADFRVPSEQRMSIEEMELPRQLKDALLENNNNEVYRVLGVETFSQYVARYLANSVINILSFLILFIGVFALIRIVTVWLDLVARLPVLHGMNQIAGAILGGLEGLLFLWVIGLFITLFAGTSGGRALIQQIESSAWLSFIYNHNLLSSFVMTVAKTIL